MTAAAASPNLTARARTSELAGPTIVEERWIAEHLGARDLFDGATSFELRRGRLRALLLGRELGDAIAGKRNGQPERWCELFARLYREPLGDSL